MAAVCAVLAAVGVFYLFTSLSLRWQGFGFGPALARTTPRRPSRTRDWLAQAGLGDVALSEFIGVVGALFVVGAAVGFLLFGGVVAPSVLAVFGATLPV